MSPALRDGEPGADGINGVHRPGVVDVVRRYQGGVHRSRTIGVHELKHEIVVAGVVDEEPIHPHVLRAHGGAEIGKLRMGGIGGRVHWIGTDVAESAGHAHAIGAHELRIIVVAGVAEIFGGIPARGGGRVEGGIGEEPEAHDPAGVAVERTHRNGLAPGADGDPGIFGLILEGIGRTIGAPHIEQQAEALRIRLRRRVEARLVHQAQIVPPPVPIDGFGRVIGDDLQQVEGAEGRGGQTVPESIIAAGPHDPHVAALDLVRRQRDPAIHVVEIVFACHGKGGCIPAGLARLVEDMSAGLRGAIEPGEQQAGAEQQHPREDMKSAHRHGHSPSQ